MPSGRRQKCPEQSHPRTRLEDSRAHAQEQTHPTKDHRLEEGNFRIRRRDYEQPRESQTLHRTYAHVRARRAGANPRSRKHTFEIRTCCVNLPPFWIFEHMNE